MPLQVTVCRPQTAPASPVGHPGRDSDAGWFIAAWRQGSMASAIRFIRYSSLPVTWAQEGAWHMDSFPAFIFYGLSRKDVIQ